LKIFKSIKSFSSWRGNQHNTTIGFVPTMGALHKGHLSLVKKSTNQCDLTIVSLFVNELQFSPNEDFKKYPRNIKKDIDLLEKHNVDIVIVPDASKIYNQNFSFLIQELDLSKKLEGFSRPQFFNGVTTIVCKLFNLVQPQRVYFGMKDIQQLCIIKKMISDLNYNIKLISCPTIRDVNGLAISSRNQYLSSKGKNEASIVYQTLKMGKELIQKNRVSIKVVKQKMSTQLLVHNFKIEYISIASLENFEEISEYQKHKTVISLAVIYENVRLIDNVII